jgi:colanic acid/amylovoran biosynthesis protein
MRLQRSRDTLSHWTDAVVLYPVYKAISLTVRSPDASRAAILVATPGSGNIGDQAMIEAFLENVPGEVVIVARKVSDVSIPEWARQRVHITELPNLIYGGLRSNHLKNIAEFAALLHRASSLSLVGADVMDGAYNPRASIRRSNLVRLGQSLGVQSRILGFSWNGQASRPVLEAAVRASKAGVRMMLRDPISKARALAGGLRNTVEVADVVFRGTTSTEPTGLLSSTQGKVALVNISAHIESSFSQVDEYVQVVTHLDKHGYHVILVPHVSRDGSDDLALARKLQSRLQVKVDLVGELLSPEAIRGLCRHASLVITGRMHLSIIALSQGVPSIILSSQGKVEGLAQRFTGSAWCVEPTAGFGKEIQGLIDRVDSVDLDQLQLQRSLSIELAGRNFVGL